MQGDGVTGRPPLDGRAIEAPCRGPAAPPLVVLVCAAAAARASLDGATWQVFWQTAVLGQRGREVARRLGMSVVAVFRAKGRALTRLRAQIGHWQEGADAGGEWGD